MPPKKKFNKTEVVPKIPKGKVPRGRFKKEKPKLKTPTIIQVKIPLPGLTPKEDNVPAVETSPKLKAPTKRKLMLDRKSKGHIAEKNNVSAVETSPGLTKTPTKKKVMLDGNNEDHIAEKDNVPAVETSPGLTKAPTKKKVMLDGNNEEKDNVPAVETSPGLTKAPTKKKGLLDRNNEGHIAEKDNVPAVENSPGLTKAPTKKKVVLDRSNEEKNNVPAVETSPGLTKASTKRKVTLDRKKNEGHITKEDIMPAPETSPGLTKAPIKIMLMLDRINEVAKAQLVKGSPVTEINIEKKKRGRKRKIVEVEPGPGAKEETSQKIAKTVPEVPSKTEVIKNPKGRTKRNLENTKPVIKRQNTRTKALKPDSTIVKRKSTRGKAAALDDDSTITSPSIISQGLLDRKDIHNPVETNVDSRRTSVNSASEWSWTKDISGSSTTTCYTVSSRDLVRIDGKFPVVKLLNIESDLKKVEALREKIEGEHSLSEDSSSSSSSSSSSNSSSISTTIDNFLNLSTSSVSPSMPRSPTYTPVDALSTPVKESQKNYLSTGATKDKLTLTLEKLKCFDLEIWSGDEDDVFLNMKEFEVNVYNYKVMDQEKGALLECKFLAHILSKKCVLSNENADVPLESEEADFAKPDASVIAGKPAGDSRNENSIDGVRRRDSVSFDDDDDALSIFAESITGIESSRVSSSASVVCGAAPALVEYVPQPLRRDIWAPVAPRHYQPTPLTTAKITEDLTPKTKPVCEKQNADSTSIQKESELADPTLHSGRVEPVSNVPEAEESQVLAAEWGAQRQQRLTISCFESQHGIKCSSLRGACFFNLISKCKKAKCLFPHVQLEPATVANRLKKLSEHQFLQEFMIFAKWTSLRMRYSKCFLEECQRRELSKFLVEMVIVYISRANKKSQEDSAIKVDIIEHALLYLNGVNLSVCEELLRFKFIDGKFLCEVFMETIANTQNFWRFKNVFINLTGFMVRARRTFKLEVASQILERVCIFPFELQLALVILTILEHTDQNIFENSMMRIFEKQLQSFSKNLYERFLAIKIQRESAPRAVDPSQEELPAVSQEVAPLNGPVAHTDCEKRYTSPDTTNLDSLNKPVVEPIIKRTINLDKIRALAHNAEGKPNNPKTLYQNWNHRSIYDQIPRLATPRGPFGPHLRPRPPLKRPMGRQVQYGPRQFQFPRRFGPDHYGNQ